MSSTTMSLLRLPLRVSPRSQSISVRRYSRMRRQLSGVAPQLQAFSNGNPDSGHGEIPETDHLKMQSSTDMMRKWMVLYACQFPSLVTFAGKFFAEAPPVVTSPLLKIFAKPTFFKVFCAGETVDEVKAFTGDMIRRGWTPVLDHSAECEIPKVETESVDVESDSSLTKVLDHNYSLKVEQIEYAASIIPGSITAVKFSAFVDPKLLVQLAEHVKSIKDDSTLSQMESSTSAAPDSKEAFIDSFLQDLKFDTSFDLEDHRSGLERLASVSFDLAELASKKGSSVWVDAEYSTMQPTIDFVTLRLQRRFNKDRAVVINTYQCYLKRMYGKVSADLADADKNNYVFGGKLVRGAYMVQEREWAEERGEESPVHDSFEESSLCYNSNVDKIIRKIAFPAKGGKKPFVVIASHNKESVQRAVNLSRELNVGEENVNFAQLFGMGDDLTHFVQQQGLKALKLTPYGSITEVMPYLIRRAQENSSMLGNAVAERRAIQSELRQRFLRPEA